MGTYVEISCFTMSIAIHTKMHHPLGVRKGSPSEDHNLWTQIWQKSVFGFQGGVQPFENSLMQQSIENMQNVRKNGKPK